MLNYEENDLIVMTDPLGHTILAVYKSETDTEIVIENPLWIGMIPNQQKPGEYWMQHIQWFFRDYLADHNESSVWHVAKSNYAIMEKRTLSQNLIELHRQSFMEMKNETPVTSQANVPQQLPSPPVNNDGGFVPPRPAVNYGGNRHQKRKK